MARIAFGFATSHAPQLVLPPEQWLLRGEADKSFPELYDNAGRRRSYAELLAAAAPALLEEITPQKLAERHAVNQRSLDTIAERFAAAKPDVVVMIGHDRREMYGDDNRPAFSVYCGSSIAMVPWGKAANSAEQPLEAAYGGKGELVASAGLARHMLTHLADLDFDVTACASLKPGLGIGHSWLYPLRRLGALGVPILPVHVNATIPPNIPSARRCYDFGAAVASSIEAWGGAERIAVGAAGGLSHMVIDEALDRSVLEAMRRGDAKALRAIPDARLPNGNGQIRPWIVAAGALAALRMQLVDYVPCYRSAAGTGCGMGFATWD
jgi:hypothetical protein